METLYNKIKIAFNPYGYLVDFLVIVFNSNDNDD